MKKRSQIWLTLLLSLVMLSVMLFPALGLADAGFFSGSDDYGSSDWGSSDWDSDWDSDWASDDDDWSSSSSPIFYDDYDDSDGGGFGFGTIVVIIVVVIVLASVFGKKGKSSGANKPVMPGAQPTAGLRPLSEFLAYDPQFSEPAFCEDVANLYIQMQTCWQNKDWEPMRSHMTDALYNQFAHQLDSLIRNGQTNYIERIAVMSVNISGWTQDEVNDKLVARLRTRITDYTVDDNTGAVINGDKNRELFMEYEWTMIRSKGQNSLNAEGVTDYHCQSCGAPMNLSHSAKCEYCGTVATAAEYDWVLSSIKGISQRTAG